MKPKLIYLEAARLIAEGVAEFACNAIDIAAEESYSRQRSDFAVLFKPRDEEVKDMGSVGWLRCTYETSEDARHRRVVALCFAAAIAANP